MSSPLSEVGGAECVLSRHFLGEHLILYFYYFTKFTTLVTISHIYLPCRDRKSVFSGDISCAIIHVVAFFSFSRVA